MFKTYVIFSVFLLKNYLPLFGGSLILCDLFSLSDFQTYLILLNHSKLMSFYF